VQTPAAEKQAMREHGGPRVMTTDVRGQTDPRGHLIEAGAELVGMTGRAADHRQVKDGTKGATT
jgi:hypothetical protein